MEQENLIHSIAKVYINNIEEYQTTWLFTQYGHLLTTGHLFHNNQAKIGSTCFVVFENNEKVYEAILEDYKKDNIAHVDYAILRLVELPSSVDDQFVIPISKFKLETYKQKKYQAIGYPSKVDTANAIICTGNISGTHPLLNSLDSNQNYWVALTMDIDFRVSGISGAPVIVNDVCIGIQSLQSNATGRFCYATIFNFIKNDIVQKALNKEIRPFYLQPKFFEGFKAIKTSNDNKGFDRNGLVIYDNLNERDLTIADSLFIRREIDNLNNIHRNEIILFNKQHEKKLKPLIFKERRRRVDDVDTLNDIVDIITNVEDDTNFNKLLRFIIDIDGKFINELDEPLKNYKENNISHLVGISFKHNSTGSEKIYVQPNINLDVNFIIEYNDITQVSKLLERLFLDILLDISYFHSLPVLVELFDSIEAQRAFSLRKLEYLRKLNNPVFVDFLQEGIDYVCFAFFAKNQSSSSLDFKRYNSLWKDFLEGEEGLYRYIDPENPPFFPITIVQLMDRIKKFKKLSGQISLIKIEEDLQLFFDQNNHSNNYLNDKLLTLVFVTKRPHSLYENRVIESAFKKEYKRMMNGVFYASKIQPLMPIVHLLQFYFFTIKAE